MKTLFKTTILITFLTLISFNIFAQSKYSVVVTVKGIQQRTGKIFATISNDENSFPQGGGIKSATAELTKEGEIILKFEGILEGKYAIVLFQDLNGDNKLDMNGQMPAEPFGFSNLTMLMGPPNFEQCAFDLNEDKNIAISLFSF
ncbi:Protein of unknown function DUF2141 [Emticicia oligotrophica DSM 17448]|uniref:DUF2141 domain-containing protein n=1 Tax=Emticicia oligotrophica (strain DSM 17448 / CIP 109782 / MTCC 6937 / GPTSA100-15) TaxID=929562 RepID=A0ABM5MZS6_EMTOG|nr:MULTISPECIES: DUF2141 domain-containing protein [Emticicia]AFK02612.1 Protein of unknown function DUF2141 [Emticicia oligotrophica DSM 17448]